MHVVQPLSDSSTAPAVTGVTDRLAGYAARGTFAGFASARLPRGVVEFRFRWLLGARFRLLLTPQRNQLVARDLLPAIEHRSFLDSDLRRFVAARSAAELPGHRRLDPQRGTLAYTNRQQQVSLRVEFAPDAADYATKALLTIINDLFTHLQLYHIDYLHRNFGLPEE